MEKKGIHDGHRDRMREKILISGIESLQPHEVLEYLLFHVVPRKDTNALAHELINTFGSFSDVLGQDADRLAAVKGMTRNAALFLSSLPDVFRFYVKDVDRPKLNLCGKEKAKRYILSQTYGKKTEEFYVVSLDVKDNLIRLGRLSKGDGDSVRVSVRDVTDFALRTNAVSVIIAHNHPSGGVNPTDENVAFTRDALWTLDGVGVTLQDHLIVGGSDVYSFEESGLISDLRKEKLLKEGFI